MNLALRIGAVAAPIAAAWLWYAMALHREHLVAAIERGALEPGAAIVAPAALPLPPVVSVASVEPASAAAPVPVRAARAAAPTLAMRFDGATDYRALYDDLLKSDSPAAKYFIGRILLTCADAASSSVDAIVQRFGEWVPAAAANRDERIAAFRRLKEPCRGFGGRREPGNPFEIFAEGARRGDPRAQARQLWADTAVPVEGRMESARQMLGHSDPYVVQNLAQFIGMTQGARMVVDGVRLDPSAMNAVLLAWDLVACDMGATCGSDSDRLLTYCAFDGFCGFESYEDLVRSAFAADVERIEDFRAKIHAALVARDAAALGIDRGSR